MADESVLVLDAGSSSIRCLMVDSRFRVSRPVSRPWTYLEEPDAPELARAFDHEACWQSAQDAISECLAGLPAADRDISAIAVTSQRQSLALLDRNLEVIYAGPNTDLRAVFEGFALDDQHGDLIHAATGRLPSFMTAPGKLAWFRDNRPDSYDRIAHILTLADWLALKFTGSLALEPVLASENGLLDITRLAPASAMFRRLGLKCPIPDIRETPSARGALYEPVSQDVPVITAGADTQCGLVGMGIVAPGSAGIVAGWSATVQLLTSAPILRPDMKTWTGRFPRPGVWTVESNAGDVGNALEWLANLLFHDRKDIYRAMNDAAQSTPLGSNGVSAFLGPKAMDVSALGMATGGFTFPTPMTLGGPTGGQLARSALESFAYALRANLEQSERVAGFEADRVALGGGITRIPLFNRIMTDVLGREIELSAAYSATALGAALIARAATGRVSSLPEAAIRLSLNNPRLNPDARDASEYDDRYQEWAEAQRALGQTLS